MQTLTFTIPTTPRTKKNHGNIIHLKNGRHAILPSKAYISFEKEVCKFIKVKFGDKFTSINFPINVKALYYKDKDYVSDLNGYNQALHDALVKAKLLKDDNHKIIISTDGSRVYLDRTNPRVEVEITKLEGDN